MKERSRDDEEFKYRSLPLIIDNVDVPKQREGKSTGFAEANSFSTLEAECVYYTCYYKYKYAVQ